MLEIKLINFIISGIIRQVVKHHSQLVYTRTTKTED